MREWGSRGRWDFSAFSLYAPTMMEGVSPAIIVGAITRGNRLLCGVGDKRVDRGRTRELL